MIYRKACTRRVQKSDPKGQGKTVSIANSLVKLIIIKDAKVRRN